MSVYGNHYNNNGLAALQAQAPQQVVTAIRSAAEKTGVDFSYLMHKAGTESSFRTDIKAKTSSATGLFQFIESTWLEMVNKHGAKYGLEKQASQISDDLRVSSNAARSSILHLRKDPELSSLMAAEYASENKDFLQRTVGGEIGNTELYLAHFMGPGGAAAFINEHRANPLNRASDIFPREARANRGVFYDPQTARPRTLEQVYAFFDKKFEGTQTDPGALTPQNQYVASAEQTEDRTQETAASPRKKGYQHIPPALYAPVEVRGNWNKGPEKTANLPDFGTPIARKATAYEPQYEPQRAAESVKTTQVFPQSLYSKVSISPVDVAFMRRLNG